MTEFLHQPYSDSRNGSNIILLYACRYRQNARVRVIATKQHDFLVAFLRAQRKAAGLRQADVAKLLGEKQQWVALIEAGQRRITVIEFLALARAIGFDPAKAIKKISKIKNS